MGISVDISTLIPPVGEWPALPASDAGAGLTLAIADDEAFNFYYPDNITLLARTGLNIVRFSPLHDSRLPDCQMIWLGGGYPELHAAGLARNSTMLAQLRAAHQRGVERPHFARGRHQVVSLFALYQEASVSVVNFAPGRVLHHVAQDVVVCIRLVAAVEHLDIEQPQQDDRRDDDDDSL